MRGSSPPRIGAPVAGTISKLVIARCSPPSPGRCGLGRAPAKGAFSAGARRVLPSSTAFPGGRRRQQPPSSAAQGGRAIPWGCTVHRVLNSVERRGGCEAAPPPGPCREPNVSVAASTHARDDGLAKPLARPEPDSSDLASKIRGPRRPARLQQEGCRYCALGGPNMSGRGVL